MPSPATLQKSSHYQNEYVGVVESVDDPDRLMRVQVRVEGIHTANIPTADLPWSEYRLPVGFRANDGLFTPVDVGDHVWVDFPYGGDHRRPRITGSVHFAPGGQPNFPHEAWQGPEPVTHKQTGREPAPAGPDYHGKAVYTQHGVTLEVNQDGSWVIVQRGTGTEIHVDPSGSLTLHCEADIHLSAQDNRYEIVERDAEIEVGKNESRTIGGLMVERASGIRMNAGIIELNS